jgi:hypothetical protein
MTEGAWGIANRRKPNHCVPITCCIACCLCSTQQPSVQAVLCCTCRVARACHNARCRDSSAGAAALHPPQRWQMCAAAAGGASSGAAAHAPATQQPLYCGSAIWSIQDRTCVCSVGKAGGTGSWLPQHAHLQSLQAKFTLATTCSHSHRRRTSGRCTMSCALRSPAGQSAGKWLTSAQRLQSASQQ